MREVRWYERGAPNVVGQARDTYASARSDFGRLDSVAVVRAYFAGGVAHRIPFWCDRILRSFCGDVPVQRGGAVTYETFDAALRECERLRAECNQALALRQEET